MMLDQLYRPRGSSISSPDGNPSMEEGQDPLMLLLQQLSGAGSGFSGMGGMGGIGGMGGMPPGMESMMSGMMGGTGIPTQTVESRIDRWSTLWVILHALGALILSFWALRGNPGIFDGSELSRTESVNQARSEKPVYLSLLLDHEIVTNFHRSNYSGTSPSWSC